MTYTSPDLINQVIRWLDENQMNAQGYTKKEIGKYMAHCWKDISYSLCEAIFDPIEAPIMQASILNLSINKEGFLSLDPLTQLCQERELHEGFAQMLELIPAPCQNWKEVSELLGQTHEDRFSLLDHGERRYYLDLMPRLIMEHEEAK